MPSRLLLVPVLATAAVAAAGGSVGIAATKRTPKPVTKVVHVIDDVYTCAGCKNNGTAKASVTVRKNTTMKWVWSNENQNSHDVNLSKFHPKGVKLFHSDLAASDFSFKRKLTVPGSYKVYCSIHTTMRLVIVVKK